MRIPKSRLFEMIDMETLKKLRFCALTEQIPPDKELSECDGQFDDFRYIQ